jgi:hypothetical protein
MAWVWQCWHGYKVLSVTVLPRNELAVAIAVITEIIEIIEINIDAISLMFAL